MPQEFQAVILAGGHGSRLPEVLGNTPKCLLTVGPYPMLWYPLNLLQQHNFQEAIVVVLENEKSEIQSSLERTAIKMKIDFITIPSDNEFGTADSLRYISDKIKSDMLIISCDTITNINLYSLVNKFRQHNAALVSVVFNSGFESGITLPGLKIKYKPEKDLIGVHPETERLLFLASTSDYEDSINIRGHLLRKNGKMLLCSHMVDSHIYVIKKWILDFLKKNEYFSTLKGEFLPYLVKKQITKAPDFNNTQTDTNSDIEGANVTEKRIFDFVPFAQLDDKILRTTFYNDNQWKSLYNGNLLRCYALKAPKDTFGIRVNSTLTYFAVNRKIASIWPLITNGQKLISSHAVLKSTQMTEIAAAYNAQLSEKTSLNYSVFGSNCSIEPKNIINNSVILAGATVEEGCYIENCIIGPKAVIKRGSKLKNCLVGAYYEVESDSVIQCKHLTHDDSFMEIDI